MVINYEVLTAFALATALLSVSPGPDIIYVLTQSISHGRKYGLAITAGLMSGCLVHTTLLAFGVSALIRSNEYIYLLIKIFGALYLFYLAFEAFKSKNKLSFNTEVGIPDGLWKYFRRGFIMNVLNPKVTVFFLAFFPGFLFSKELGLVLQFYVLGILFILVSFGVFAGVALLSGSISNYVRRHSGTGPLLKWMEVLVYTCIGLYLIFSEN